MLEISHFLRMRKKIKRCLKHPLVSGAAGEPVTVFRERADEKNLFDCGQF